MKKLGIFCKPVHIEKLVAFLNTTDIDYCIFSNTKTNQRMAYYGDFDIGISYCAGFIIDLEKERRIRGKNRPWFNFHPHPLPQYKGYDAYAKAINGQVPSYGVTLHRLVQEVDAGEVIEVYRFSLFSRPVHPDELGCICHYFLFHLFKNRIEEIANESL